MRHSPTVREVAGRAWFMNKGAVAKRGAPAQMFDAPRSPRLQAFLPLPHRSLARDDD